MKFPTWLNKKTIEERLSHYILVFAPLVWGLLIATIIFVSFLGFYFPDIWWQLENGYYFLLNGHLTPTPIGAFGIPNPLSPQEYAVYEITIAWLHKFVGLGGLRAIFILIVLFPFALVFWYVRKTLSCLIFYYISMALFCLIARFQQRPELVTFSLFVLLGAFLIENKHDKMWKNFVIPFLIMCVWANIHSSFIVGWMTLGCYWFAAFAKKIFSKEETAPIRQLLIDFALQTSAAFFGTVLTPHGLRRFLDPFILQSAEWSKIASPEMYPMPVIVYPLLFGSSALVLLSLYFGIIRQHALWISMLTCLFTAMSVLSNRYIGLLGCMLLISIIAHVKFPRKKELRPIFSSFVHFPILIFCFIPMLFSMTIGFCKVILRSLPEGAPQGTFAQKSLEELSYQVDLQRTPILTDIIVSSYTHFHFPNLYPMLDTGFNRFDQDTIRYSHFIYNEPNAFRLALENLHINHVVIGFINAQWLIALNQLPNWKLTIFQTDGAAYTRASAVDEAHVSAFLKIKPILVDFGLLRLLRDPNDWLARLATIKVPLWASEVTVYFVMDALQNIPRSERQKLLEELQNTQPHHVLNALLAHSLGDYELALKLVPPTRFFDCDTRHLLLAQIALDAGKPDLAQKYLKWFIYRPKYSLWYQTLISRITKQPNPYSWNEQTKTWFLQHTEKLNRRLEELGLAKTPSS